MKYFVKIFFFFQSRKTYVSELYYNAIELINCICIRWQWYFFVFFFFFPYFYWMWYEIQDCAKKLVELEKLVDIIVLKSNQIRDYLLPARSFPFLSSFLIFLFFLFFFFFFLYFLSSLVSTSPRSFISFNRKLVSLAYSADRRIN